MKKGIERKSGYSRPEIDEILMRPEYILAASSWNNGEEENVEWEDMF